ncbi:MAG TPA: LamG-like jellyroll fold domain-containing protein [Methylomirabilota bacterium]|nr:LamG-like jellyroll fold domain-containing protein [Methylomirabilota bacterium]
MASEDQGVANPVTVTWDHAGRLWTMTATEYPVDAHDNAEIAAALYTQPRSDRVLVFDDPYSPGPHQPRVFADGLAIPLGLLPVRNGALVQHGRDILLLRDTNGDGHADSREPILTGFGIGDSHLMPHQFTRAPGGWILVAQGAFNNSSVRTRSGETVEFNRTVMGRFTPDGRRFETIGWGPCNIWGLVLNSEGEIFIQEANDYGYPVMPFHVGACYPGCTPFPKPYAPAFPALSNDPMGGTGLSGLALSDATPNPGWPAPYADVFYVANPITRRIQAVKLLRDGPHGSLQKLPDFIRSSDEWFRPVAIHFGPDGCLYIVDWYNPIISHNEVPRNHPDRDKSHGRIWRVRHTSQSRNAPPDFTQLPDSELLAQLASNSQWRQHTAWQQIVDRHASNLADRLIEITLANPSALRAIGLSSTPNESSHQDVAARIRGTRIHALWSLEGLGHLSIETIRPLLADPHRNLRREALRAISSLELAPDEILALVSSLANDPDPDVRAEVIRTAAPLGPQSRPALALLVRMALEPLGEPLARSTHNGQPIPVREAYDRAFERYLIRAALELHPDPVATFLESTEARQLPLENRLLAALAIEPENSAAHVARLLPSLNRPPHEEELLRLAEFLDQPGVGEALQSVLRNPSTRSAAAEALLRGRTRFDTTRLVPLLTDAARALLAGDNNARALALRLAAGFQLGFLEPELASSLESDDLSTDERIALLRALREMSSNRVDLFARLAATSSDPMLRHEAVLTLAGASPANAAPQLFAIWNRLDHPRQRAALDRLAATRAGAESIVSAIHDGSLPKSGLHPAALEKMLLLLGDHPGLQSLLDDLGTLTRPVLKLDGQPDSYVDCDLTLTGPFTVETWIRLDPGLTHEDGILGRPGGADFNFHDGRLRVFAGPSHGDRIIARRAMTPGLWTHVAITRDDTGSFRIYLDGELDTDESQPFTGAFTSLDIGRTTPSTGGTSALFAEFRVWNECRSANNIRAAFDRAFASPLPSGLVHFFSNADSWKSLHGGARVVPTIDSPPLLAADEARAQAEKFARYRALAAQTGDLTRGRELAVMCLTCHRIGGEGASLGPDLSGAGAMNTDALLRSLLTPNVAMEAGYRVFRVELNNDEILEGFLVTRDGESILLRIPNSEDRRIPMSDVRDTAYLRRSLMPEGLIEALPDPDAAALLEYLQSLK